MAADTVAVILTVILAVGGAYAPRGHPEHMRREDQWL